MPSGEQSTGSLRHLKEAARHEERAESERELEGEAEEKFGLERRLERASATVERALEVLLQRECERRKKREQTDRHGGRRVPGEHRAENRDESERDADREQRRRKRQVTVGRLLSRRFDQPVRGRVGPETPRPHDGQRKEPGHAPLSHHGDDAGAGTAELTAFATPRSAVFLRIGNCSLVTREQFNQSAAEFPGTAVGGMANVGCL